MPKEPSFPHQVIVDYILAGHTTQEAKDHFEFKNDNIANLRVHAAFRALGVKRPRYLKPRICEFCGCLFIARDYKQRTCGAQKCQKALIADWQKQNPEKVRKTLRRYRKTEKGRQNNIRTHRRMRELGKRGSAKDRWNYASTEIKKSLRKRVYLAFRNPWEYRIHHIQKVAQAEREINPRNKRKISTSHPSIMWQQALRALQTTLIHYRSNAVASLWEKAVNRLSNTLRMGEKVRLWKRKQKKGQSLLIT